MSPQRLRVLKQSVATEPLAALSTFDLRIGSSSVVIVVVEAEVRGKQAFSQQRERVLTSAAETRAVAAPRTTPTMLACRLR